MKKKIIIIIIVLIVLGLFKIITSKTYFSCDVKPDKTYGNLGNINYQQYQCLINNDKKVVIMYTQSKCSFCKDFKPIINEYAKKHKTPIYILEVNTVETSIDEITRDINYFSTHQSWGTPLTLALEKKQVITKLTGYTKDKNELNDFFKELKK
ncbi:MAG: thioredoxin family protein [Bacilli bacterium]|nr:thioredoxin family protein [Bacilli bacterium]